MPALVFLAAWTLGLLALAMLLPVLVAFVTGAPETAAPFVAVAGMLGFVAGALVLATRGAGRRLDRLGLLGFVIFIWTVPPIIAAIPIAQLAGTGYASALFEAVSGYTTTGATVFPTLEPIPPAILFWRAELNWIGGLVTLILLLAVVAPARFTGTPGGVFGAAGLGGIHRPTLVIGRIAGLYLVATGATILLLLLTDLPPFDAICLGLSAISTGGFVPADGAISDYGNPLAETVLILAMLLGATGFLWQSAPPGRRSFLRSQRESVVVLVVVVVAAIAYVGAGAPTPSGDGQPGDFRAGLFSAVSLVTTTGFEGAPHGLALVPVAATLLLAFCGGATVSTAGGVKYLRVGLMLARSIDELRRLVYPHAVRTARFGPLAAEIGVMKTVWSYMSLAIAAIAVASLFLMAAGVSFEGSLVAATAAFANIGPLYEAGWPEGAAWPHYGMLGAPSQLVLAAAMILGRIEILALFGLAAGLALRKG